MCHLIPDTVYSVMEHLNKLSERSISLFSTGMGSYPSTPTGDSPNPVLLTYSLGSFISTEMCRFYFFVDEKYTKNTKAQRCKNGVSIHIYMYAYILFIAKTICWKYMIKISISPGYHPSTHINPRRNRELIWGFLDDSLVDMEKTSALICI